MIVKATQNDINSIMDCYKATIQRMHDLKIFQWDNSYPTIDLIENDIKHNNYYIYKDNGEILGGVCLNQDQHPTYSNIQWSFNEPVIVVHRLAINPSAQGKGIAKKMMKFVEELCITNAYKGIRLDTFVDNKLAIGLYLKLGYKQLDRVHFKNRTYYCFDKEVIK